MESFVLNPLTVETHVIDSFLRSQGQLPTSIGVADSVGHLAQELLPSRGLYVPEQHAIVLAIPSHLVYTSPMPSPEKFLQVFKLSADTCSGILQYSPDVGEPGGCVRPTLAYVDKPQKPLQQGQPPSRQAFNLQYELVCTPLSLAHSV